MRICGVLEDRALVRPKNAQLSRGRHNAEENFVARLISMCWVGVLSPLLRII
jgi:hypothetical protein